MAETGDLDIKNGGTPSSLFLEALLRLRLPLVLRLLPAPPQLQLETRDHLLLGADQQEVVRVQ